MNTFEGVKNRDSLPDTVCEADSEVAQGRRGLVGISRGG